MKSHKHLSTALRAPALKTALMTALLAALLAASTAAAAPPASSSSSSSSTSSSSRPTLSGVDPASYMQKRNHKPDVLKELEALPADVAVEVLKDPDAFLVDAGQSKDQRVIERRALRQGALASLARRGDPRAVALLHAHVADDDDAVAAVALENLGRTRDPGALPVLAAILGDDRQLLDRRCAAAAGLGHQRSAAALELLVPALHAKNDDVRISAMRALANLSSRWAWEAKKDPKTGDELRARARTAVEAVSVDGADSADVQAVRTEVLGLLR